MASVRSAILQVSIGKDSAGTMIKKDLLETVNFLSHDIGSRSYGETANLDRSADYIQRRFSQLGFPAKRQSFRVDGTAYHNIHAEISGIRYPDEILVIGAHYDTVPGTPGADDNASGIAGLLAIAKIMSEHPPCRTVMLAAFTLEEPPFFRTRQMGSYIFAESLYQKKIRVRGMISLEMIGYFTEKKGGQHYPLPLFRWFYPETGDYIAFVGNVQSKAFTEKFKKSFKKYSSLPCESLNTVSVVPGVDFSDHRSFWKFNYPAFMITDTAFYRNPHYHGPGDTAETLDYDRMALLVIGISKSFEEL